MLNPIIILTILYIARLLKIRRKDWKMFEVLQILFGVSSLNEPQRAADKIIFLNIILLSFQYSIDFYSQTLDIHLISGEVPFDSIEDILESPFTLYICKCYYKKVFDTDIEVLAEPSTMLLVALTCYLMVLKLSA